MGKIDIKNHDETEDEAEEHVKELMGPSEYEEPHVAPPTRKSFLTHAPTEPTLKKIVVDTVPTTAPEVAEPVAAEPAAEPSFEPFVDLGNPASDEGVDELLAQPIGELADDHAAEQVAADSATDKAVDEITKHEGDEVLAGIDAKAERAIVMKPTFFERIKNGFQNWWDKPIRRYTTIFSVIAVIAVVALVPIVRSYALNIVGVRAKVSLSVLDATTSLPLKNVQVSIAGETAKTDEQGVATVAHVKLGKQQLVVEKLAFATQKSTVSVGFGTLHVRPVSLKAVGTQFTFQLSDFLSGKVVAGAEVSSGQATALSDAKGKAILTVQPSDSATLDTQVSAKGYRTEKVAVNATSTKAVAVALVSSRKAVFVSKQSGKYNLYSIDVDGKNKQVLLAATGNETAALALSVSPDGTKAAFVSTRDNQHDNDGFLLSTLTLIDIATGSSATLDHSQAISLLGWSGSKLVYDETVASASAANPNRQRIYAYDYTSTKRSQLASANYFNAALLANNAVYYAVSSTDPKASSNFNKINVDGTGKQQLLNQEVWTLFRTAYATLSLQGPGGWFTYTLGTSAAKAGTAPSVFASRLYTENTDNSKALWVDSRDGKGVLLSYDVAATKDTVLATQNGLNGGVRWLDANTAIYRVTTNTETADYAISLQGGTAHKITDVTSTAGLTD